jgi:hypothetical protein
MRSSSGGSTTLTVLHNRRVCRAQCTAVTAHWVHGSCVSLQSTRHLQMTADSADRLHKLAQ